MSISTGLPVLDDLVAGGFPDGRVVLVIGGPGTGKTTLGLQYLQAGLESGERCLFVSTEQTPTELQETYGSFAFDLDHDRLTLITIHQQPDESFEDDEPTLRFKTMDEEAEEDPFPGVPTPFSVRYLLKYLERYADHDRVVLDSISGLASLAEDASEFRRAVLDLTWLFSDEFEATTVFTAEEAGGRAHEFPESSLLEYTAHGVIRLFEEDVRGSLHRYLRVRKMRGVDHDRRKHEFKLTTDGLSISPQRPTSSPVYAQEPLSTGIEGLDRICGGGLFYKQPVVIQHDGRIDIDPITTSIMCESIENGGGAVLFAPAHLDADRLDGWIASRVGPSRDLLDDDRLFVLDWFDSWGIDHPNVFPIHRGRLRELTLRSQLLRDPLFRGLYRRIDRRRGDRDVVSIVYTETILHDLPPETIRFHARWVQPNIFHDEDVLVVTHNPAVMESRLVEFFAYDAVQVFDLWRESGNLNYVSVEKSPRGVIGDSRLVENTDEPPYISVDH